MASKFTKGPWTYESEGGDDGFIRSESADRLWIASTVDIPSRNGGEKATKSNGHLLAAAPELLKTLKAVLYAYKDYGARAARDSVEYMSLTAAREAIRKAEATHE